MSYLLHFINKNKYMRCLTCKLKESKLINIFLKIWAQMVAVVFFLHNNGMQLYDRMQNCKLTTSTGLYDYNLRPASHCREISGRE